MKRLILTVFAALLFSCCTFGQSEGTPVRIIFGAGTPSGGVAHTEGTSYVDNSVTPAVLWVCTSTSVEPNGPIPPKGTQTCNWTQAGGGLHGAGAPTGSCTQGSTYTNDSNGDFYACSAGSWLKVNAAGGNPAFSSITTGTNTTGLTMGTGGSLGVSGSGTIAATSVPYSGLTSVPAACTNQVVTNFTATPCTSLTTSFLPSTAVTSTANDTNVTASISSQVLTLGWTGTLAKARNLATAVYTDQSNTFTAGTQDFSGITLFKGRLSAGLTTSANGDFGFDTTNNNWHFWNGADLIMAPLASGFVSGHCGQPTTSAGKWTIVDTGNPCGSGGGSITASGNSANQLAYWTSGTNLSGFGPGITGQLATANNAAPPTYNSPGLGGRSVSGATDTILCDSTTAQRDRAATVQYTSASAVAVTLPDAGSSGCGSNFVFSVFVTGAGTVTVTRQTASTITWVNGYSQAASATSIALPQNSWVTFSSPDNVNWIVRGVGVTTLPNAALTNPSTTVNTQTCTLGSTCTVTPANIFTANYNAHQFLGNNTASATPPTASLIGGSDTGPNEYAADSGAVNAYVIAPTPAITALTINARAAFTTANANTGASTINVSTLGVKNLTKRGATALVSGDILTTAVYDIRYDGTEWEVLNPSSAGGTIAGSGTTNTIAKFTAGTTIGNSLLTDDGTTVSAQANPLATEIANDGSTGTTVNLLAKLSAAAPSKAILPLVSDIGGIIGVVTGGAGTTGSAKIATVGQANCVADNATTAGDYVQVGTTTAGRCKDAGASKPSSGQILGRFLASCSSGASCAVVLFGPEIAGASGAVNSGTIGQTAYYASSGAAVSGVGPGTAKQIYTSGGAGTPAFIDFPETFYIPAANNVNGSGGIAWTCPSATPAVLLRNGTNNKDGLISPWGASDICYFKLHLPNDWDSGASLDTSIDLTSTDATNGHTIIMQAATSCAKGDGSTTDDVAFNTAQSFGTITLNGNANRTWNATLTGLTKTGCTAGSTLWIKVSRTTDTATNVGVYGATVDVARLLVVQAN